MTATDVESEAKRHQPSIRQAGQDERRRDHRSRPEADLQRRTSPKVQIGTDESRSGFERVHGHLSTGWRPR